ncbi:MULTISPECIES: acyl-CoA thioesterase [Comamonas]|uniref:acyl-CoA thioesterase n=1 Tax=Comamonas TaxID=283 RepID=UPI00050E712D|nr:MULTISPECIES: thioesterase family protein [Comamonas]KGG90080.1 acyl-CoA thioesterase [Comamonas thiooxydans]KGG91229.1 acyl-CoA thioesterase [Comamonas thiooxydans]KGG96842.1 acyl-CoA thioesterase [Comamonas thiooxydans]KGH05363.1 acyl-CoA thioesterase [Comamonas thiooxydans]KGH13229.1 acyl-CoA thioesterase [Comamonas thiooxydans]
MSTDLHPFDRAVALSATGVPNQYQGTASPDYWNMVGPYGGITAASLVQAIQQHPQCLGDPLSITVNYAAAVGPGAFEIEARPVRTNRSTQHWLLTITQPDAEGQPQIVTTATAVTAVRRQTWSVSDMPMPEVRAAAEVERVPPLFKASEWLTRYEMRFVDGILPRDEDGAERDSLTRLWVRDNPPRPLDFASLAAVSDVFFPRAWLRRAKRVPAGTVSITVYFHAGREELAEAGDGLLLAQARGQEFRNGFFDQTAQLWSQSGQMLATSHQIVYYKE